MIDRETTNKILETADIVDVVSEFVTLRKAGANFKGLCPFHNERTPSFSVSPARNYCHCFSCGKGGSPVGFIMEHEQMTYPEALRWLAQKYHIEIREREMTDVERQQQSERESMFIVNEWAAKHYNEILREHPDGIAVGMQYFRSRGFRDDIIEKFRLGFALNDRHEMPRTAVSKGYKAKFLQSTGLCYEGGGELVDRFSGRAIFPWISMSGKVVAFGGRVLDSRTKGVNQKYVNSPDSEIYHKDHELYGIFQAKKQIAKEDRVFMVEGYTDVISMHQCGIENVVANSGTALSMHQVRMLHRLTNNIVLLYDGDAAGIKAAMRGTDMLLSEGMNIKVLILPDGDDPDSFSRKHSAEEFREYVESHQTDFIQFKTDVLLQGVNDPIKRSEAISSIIRSVSVIPDHIIRATYIQECSMRLRMREQTLIDQMNKFINEERDRQKKRQSSAYDDESQQHSTSSAEHSTASAQRQRADEMVSHRSDDRQLDPAHSQVSNSSNPSNPSNSSNPSNPSNPIEEPLIEVVIRYGEKVIMDNVETEDGQTISLTVAEYIDYDLSSDDLHFSNPVYERIVKECVEKSHKENFSAIAFFSQHPDFEISRCAMDKVIDRYNLSQSHTLVQTKEGLLQHINHLLLEYRMCYVSAQTKDILHQISTVSSDDPNYLELMSQYQQMQKLRNALAKKLGRHRA